MNCKFLLPNLIFFIFLITPKIESQRGNDLTPYQAYMIELKEYRKNCRNALKPYRYDGSLTTHFSYKEYVYAKEVEVPFTKWNKESRRRGDWKLTFSGYFHRNFRELKE